DSLIFKRLSIRTVVPTLVRRHHAARWTHRLVPLTPRHRLLARRRIPGAIAMPLHEASFHGSTVHARLLGGTKLWHRNAQECAHRLPWVLLPPFRINDDAYA